MTGAAGFLGSHLVHELIKKGYQVIGIDNLTTGKIDNLKSSLENEQFTFIQHDVIPEKVVTLEELADVDEIYHLASPASPKLYQADSFGTIMVNTVGTKNMLELARRNDAKILFASTSEVYGNPKEHPQREGYNGNVTTWGPRACYDEAKRLGEVFCYEYFHRFNVKVKVVRIFNTYSAGLRNDDGRVISNFVTQALLQKDITVYGDGSQTRSFCYVDDMIRGLIMMMDSPVVGEIINLGSTIEYPIVEVAELVKELTSSSSSIVFFPLPQDDPNVRRPIIEKAKQLLGWEPKIKLEEGLKRTISVYRQKLNLT